MQNMTKYWVGMRYEICVFKFHLIKLTRFPDNFKTKRKETLATAPEDNCNKCTNLEQLLSIERTRAGAKLHEDLEESSICSSRKDVKIKTKSNKQNVNKQNHEVEMLCGKINDFMIAKDQEKNLIENMKEQLKHYESEVIELRDKLREKDEHLMRQQYEDSIKHMNNVIGSQNEKIIQQNAELQKTKNMLQVATLREKVKTSGSGILEESGKTESLVGDFLENMRTKLTNIENSELIIYDDFEELSVASSGKEARDIIDE